MVAVVTKSMMHKKKGIADEHFNYTIFQNTVKVALKRK